MMGFIKLALWLVALKLSALGLLVGILLAASGSTWMGVVVAINSVVAFYLFGPGSHGERVRGKRRRRA
jgi:hypothetical protein